MTVTVHLLTVPPRSGIGRVSELAIITRELVTG